MTEFPIAEILLFSSSPKFRLTKGGTTLELPMANGNIVKIPVDEMASGFDLSEEINKSTAWTSLEARKNMIANSKYE